MRWPPEKRRAPPAGYRGAPLENIALDCGDNPKHKPPHRRRSTRHPGPGELAALRAIWWRQAAQGHRQAAELDIILIEGGAK